MKSLELIDEGILNIPLIVSLVVHICTNPPVLKDGNGQEKDSNGAILIFVSGLSDIRDVVDAVQSTPMLNADSIRVLPLHSTLSSQEQARVFLTTPPHVRKIVVATNIAETSITIPVYYDVTTSFIMTSLPPLL